MRLNECSSEMISNLIDKVMNIKVMNHSNIQYQGKCFKCEDLLLFELVGKNMQYLWTGFFLLSLTLYRFKMRIEQINAASH